VLERDVKFSLMLPCPISIYVEGAKTHISTLLPTSIAHFFPHAGIESVAADIETAALRIVDAAR
jgi:uncharacterized protein (DUF302 family)